MRELGHGLQAVTCSSDDEKVQGSYNMREFGTERSCHSENLSISQYVNHIREVSAVLISLHVAIRIVLATAL